ncbi:MAG: hypothetical protein QOF98_3571 [Streptomyces sp.]|nr:hypothetical protein [Streptomyces sp.]
MSDPDADPAAGGQHEPQLPSEPQPESEPQPAGALRYAVTKDEPADQPQGRPENQPEDRPETGGASRFWSARRVPAALTAAAILGLSGLFLYDVASVRADREAMSWRKTLADQLATRHLDNVWIIVGAAVSAALGVWLIVLAVTPGERGVLPMARRGPSGVRAGLDRHAAELVLRDRAMEVSGVRWARVAVGRRRITARAASHFRELTEVQQELTTALNEAVRQLGLARPPHLSVQVQRAEKKA